MRIRNGIKTIKTICGKTITYLQEEGKTARAHSTTGPAIVYSEEENKSPEYYLYGVKYTKQRWKELLSQSKVTPAADASPFDLVN
jgi:hypothetical protein